MLEFYTTLLVYLFFLASQWFHTFKSFSNLALPFFTLEMFLEKDIKSFWDSTSHENTCMHFVGITAYSGNFKVVLIDRWYFYTGSPGSTAIVHHNNNNVLIPPYNTAHRRWPVDKHIMEKFTLHIFLYLHTTLKLHEYVLYNICFC